MRSTSEQVGKLTAAGHLIAGGQSALMAHLGAAHAGGSIDCIADETRRKQTALQMLMGRGRGDSPDLLTLNRSDEQAINVSKGKKGMKLFDAALTVSFVALIGGPLAPGAAADDWNRKTVISFSSPVEIPGVHLAGWGVLPAGTYVFKILDSQSDRHIVQIFSKDETTIYATILAIPNYRLRTTDKTVMTFTERPAGEPEALRAWFYPGRNWGEEFVYPKAKAMALAKDTNTPVLFTAVEIPVEVAEPIKTADAPVVVEMKQAPIMAAKPTGEAVELAEVVTPPPTETLTAMAPALPATASTLPLMFLFGLLALCAAFAVRGMARRLQ